MNFVEISLDSNVIELGIKDWLVFVYDPYSCYVEESYNSHGP